MKYSSIENFHFYGNNYYQALHRGQHTVYLKSSEHLLFRCLLKLPHDRVHSTNVVQSSTLNLSKVSVTKSEMIVENIIYTSACYTGVTN